MSYKRFINLLFNEIEFLISYLDVLKVTESEKKDLLENFQNIKSILTKNNENTKEDFVIEIKW